MEEVVAETEEVTAEIAEETGEAAPWYGEGASEATQGYVKTKGWSTAQKVINAYQSLEKLQRNGNKDMVSLPKEDATAEEFNEFYTKTGRPESADKYDLKFDPNVPIDDAYVKGFKESAHSLGLNSKQVQGLADFQVQFLKESEDERSDQAHAQAQADQRDVEKRWGNKFDERVELSKRAVKTFADRDPVVLKKLEDALGTKGFLEFWYKIANSTRESELVDGSALTSFGKSPQEAKAEINNLMLDPVFVAAYLDASAPGHKESVERMVSLNKIAHNGP